MPFVKRDEFGKVVAVYANAQDDAAEWIEEGHPDLAMTPAVPSQVTMRQARLALHAAGLLDQVTIAIDALTDPPRTEARIEWDYSSVVYRNKPFVTMLGHQLGLNDEQIDQLFITASGIE